MVMGAAAGCWHPRQTKGPCAAHACGGICWDGTFLSPPPANALSCLRNSCDWGRVVAQCHRSLCSVQGAGTPFLKALSPWHLVPAAHPLTPLSVLQVEDGGKAALSRRLQPGDELVNISGTPLYGSRQEALILIKGSYRTLKMIVRRSAALWVEWAGWAVVAGASPAQGTGRSLVLPLSPAWRCPMLG